MEKWIETNGPIWNCAIISGNYSKHLDSYLKLFNEARRDFKHLTYDEVECLEVKNSIRCKGNSMLCFQIPANNKIPGGWRKSNNIEELRR